MIPALLYNEYVQFVLILLGSIFLAKVMQVILRTYAHRITAKTKTDLDEIILGILTTPLYLLMLVGGLYFAVRSLSILTEYSFWTDGLFFVLAVLIVAATLSRVLSFSIGRWLKVQKRFEKTPKLVIKISIISVYLLAVLIILGHFNVEITPLVATLGLGGLAVGLALQNTLSNFFAGLHIISDRPVNVGDYVELPDVKLSGYVEDIGWRSTRIRTLPNTRIIVSNSKLAESVIVNYSLPEQEMAALVEVGVDYGSDLKKVEKVVIDVATKIQKIIPGAVKSFTPFIRFHTFGDSNINFTVILRVEMFVDQYLVKHEFIKALKDAFDKEKIEISWPVRKVYYSDKSIKGK